MRTILLLSAFALAAADAPPKVFTFAPPHGGSVTYGPADMECDLDQCHLFKVPGLPANATVDFHYPQLSGQQKMDIRRCFSVCTATVTGYPANLAHATPDQRNPSVQIEATEMTVQ